MRHNQEAHYLSALRKREKHLQERLRGLPKTDKSFDRLEKAALGWAIANLEHLENRGGNNAGN